MHPKCKQSIVVIGAVTAFILECPFPHEKCRYKPSHEHIHYETYLSLPVENPTMVIATTAASIVSRNVILVRPDSDRGGHQIYYIDVTASPTK